MFFGIHLGQEKITCKASNIWSVFGYTGRFSTHSNQHQKTTSKAVVREDTLESKWNNSTKLHFTNKKNYTLQPRSTNYSNGGLSYYLLRYWRTRVHTHYQRKNSLSFIFLNQYFFPLSTINEWLLTNVS